ncbi:hypothetical protein L2E82_13894 [Cichorium intybus]|uniref:Uncharacterized protein n=1 Tax=Cichorium intybus TaxID=13427 RepID=A0ACB9EYW7_CICIN|nr:hypothetical protein L2E82_13894 [Cichorium intybus]
MVPMDGAYEGSKAAYKDWDGCLMEDGTSSSILPSEFVRLGHHIQKGSHKWLKCLYPDSIDPALGYGDNYFVQS